MTTLHLCHAPAVRPRLPTTTNRAPCNPLRRCHLRPSGIWQSHAPQSDGSFRQRTVPPEVLPWQPHPGRQRGAPAQTWTLSGDGDAAADSADVSAACVMFSGFRGTARCGHLQEDKARRGVHFTYVVLWCFLLVADSECVRTRVRNIGVQEGDEGVPPRRPRTQCSPTSTIFPALTIA